MADRKSKGNLDPAIVSFFKGKGYTDAQAKGIAAGIFAESGNNHQAVNKDSGALGLGQWLGSRQDALIRRYGPNPSKKDQLEFIHYELQGGDKGGESVLRSKTAQGALNAYINNFMRPAKGAETSGDIQRGMSALGLGSSETVNVPKWKTRPSTEQSPIKSTFDIIQERRARKQAQEGGDLASVYQAYKNGRMTQEEAAQFEHDVESGVVMLPRGGELNRQVAAYTLPRQVIDAYNSHAMTDEERAQVDEDIKNGVVSLPKGVILNRPAPRTAGEFLGMGARDIATGAGGVVDILAGPLNVIANLTGAPQALVGQELSTTPTRDLANQLADKLGLARPESETEKLQSAAIEGATGGLITYGLGTTLAPAQAALAPMTKAEIIGQALTSAPALDVISGATSGAAAEKARQEGAGPLGQIAAALVGGGAPVAATGVAAKIRGARAATAGPRVGAAVDEIVADVPARVIVDDAGRITNEGIEIATRHGLDPDEVAAAAQRKMPIAEPPPVAVPAVEAAPTEIGVAAEARMARAAEEGVPLTRGQATQAFEIQDAEQSLRAATGKEADQARAFLAEQNGKIQAAVEKLRSSYGDITLTKTERGQVVKDAIRELRDEGKRGVSQLYRQAEELGGDQLKLDTSDILSKARDVLVDEGVPEPVRKSITQQLAKYKLIGKAGKMNAAGDTKIVIDDGSTVTIRGETQDLSVGNAEDFREAINRLYMQDSTRQSQSIKRAIDDAVEAALEKTPPGEAPAVREARIAARAAHKEQKETFSARDVIQRLIDFKKGTKTDVVLPERAIPEILGTGPESLTNLRKVKAILLSNATEDSKAAWKAIQAQGIADIFDKAYTVNANIGGGQIGAISGAKLNSAIDAFGTAKLKTLLDADEYSQLMKLKAIIGDATIPISGTTNPSGTAYKLVKFIGQIVGTLHGIPLVGQAVDIVSGMYKQVKQITEMQETLRNMTEYTPSAAARETGEASSKAAKIAEIKAKSDEIANAMVEEFITQVPRLVSPLVAAGQQVSESQHPVAPPPMAAQQ